LHVLAVPGWLTRFLLALPGGKAVESRYQCEVPEPAKEPAKASALVPELHSA
jgi:hypothetical protein